MRKLFKSFILSKDTTTLDKLKFYPVDLKKIQELAKEECTAVAGAPQIRNDPQG